MANAMKLFDILLFPSGQETLLLGFGVGDLVGHNADSALGDDVRGTVSDLNGHHRLCCPDSKHWEKVDDWVSAPADDCHDLGNLDLAPDLRVSLLGCCACKASQENIDNVAEEGHGRTPADPA